MSTTPDLDLNKYVAVARKWWWLLVLSAVVGGSLSFVVSMQLPKTYMANLSLLVGDDTANPNPNVEDVTVSQRLAAVYAGMVNREPVLTATVNALQLPTSWSELQRRVLVVRTDGSQLLEIRVSDSDPVRTKATVDELARQLTLQSPTAENAEELDRRRAFVRQQLQRIQTNIQEAEITLAEKQAAMATETSARGVLDIQDEIKALELNLTNWRASYAAILGTNITKGANTLTVVQPSVVPWQPTGPNVRVNVLMGGLIGLIIALGAVFLLERVRGERLTTPEDVSRTFALPVAGTIGRMGPVRSPQERVVVAHAPHSTFAEDFRRLRTNVQFAWGNNNWPLMLLVTSSSPEEGKSVTSANLAAAFARAGRRTILVDADLIRPSVHTLFGLPNAGGMASLFWGDAVDSGMADYDAPASGDLASLMRHRLDALLVPSGLPGLRLLPAGTAGQEESTDLLPVEDIEQLLEALRDLADVIIVDAPPVLAAAETASMAALGLGVLLVVESGQARSSDARMMLDALGRGQAHLLGVVLNKTQTSTAGYYDYYRRRETPPGRAGRVAGMQ